MDISTSEITPIKVRGNNVDFLTIEITSKKVRGHNVDFSTIEILSKKVRGNNMDSLTSEITSKKERGNEVDFSISKITSKKYAEVTWKFVEIWSLTYRCNIDVELTWIRRGVPVRHLLLIHFPLFPVHLHKCNLGMNLLIFHLLRHILNIPKML